MTVEAGFNLSNPFETVGDRGWDLNVPGYGDTMDSLNNAPANKYNQGTGEFGLPKALVDFLVQRVEPSTENYRNEALRRRLKVLG